MRAFRLKFVTLVCAIALSFMSAAVAKASDPELSKEQMKEFLLKAKVLSSKHTSKGITDPWRLTLSDGTVTHEAVFQSVDVHKPTMQFADGTTEINFVDSSRQPLHCHRIHLHDPDLVVILNGAGSTVKRLFYVRSYKVRKELRSILPSVMLNKLRGQRERNLECLI